MHKQNWFHGHKQEEFWFHGTSKMQELPHQSTLTPHSKGRVPSRLLIVDCSQLLFSANYYSGLSLSLIGFEKKKRTIYFNLKLRNLVGFEVVVMQTNFDIYTCMKMCSFMLLALYIYHIYSQ